MRRALFAAVVLVTGVLVGLVATRLVAIDEEVDDNAARQAALFDAIDDLRFQIISEGEQPVAPAPERIVAEGPAGERGADGERGERGSRGERGADGADGEQGPSGRPPTDAEIGAAVTRYCAVNPCVGPPGPGPSAEQVRAAVDGYCATNGCAGEPGPGPSDEQVATAVANYCSSGACTGPAGPAGPQGPRGPAPASFTFEARNQSFVCTDPDGDGNYTCTSQEPAGLLGP